MPTDIAQIKIVKSEAFNITEEAFNEFMTQYEDNTPGGFSGYKGLQRSLDRRSLPWISEFSGSSYEILTDNFLPLFSGSADLVVIWDNQVVDGLRVTAGKVTYHTVTHVLGDEIK